MNCRSWDDLPNAFAATVDHVLPSVEGSSKDQHSTPGKHLLLIVMDFNAPNARDNLTLQKLCKSVFTVATTHGVQNTVVFAIMATRAKEDSQDDPFEDEFKIMQEMKKAGFVFQQRVRMQLTPPNEENVSASNWDFWQDGRLLYPFPDEKETSVRSEWYINSELARTTRIEGGTPTIQNCEMSHIADEDSLTVKAITASMRAAQRGVDANLAIMQQLLTKSKARPRSEMWLQAKDMVDVLELHPHNGDRTIAIIKMITQGSLLSCKLRTLLASIQYKKTQQFVKFTQASFTITQIVYH